MKSNSKPGNATIIIFLMLSVVLIDILSSSITILKRYILRGEVLDYRTDLGIDPNFDIAIIERK